MKKKVIVIGLDGLEPSIVEAMLERGELPHFEKIRAAGGYSRLKTTYPAQTPEPPADLLAKIKSKRPTWEGYK